MKSAISSSVALQMACADEICHLRVVRCRWHADEICHLRVARCRWHADEICHLFQCCAADGMQMKFAIFESCAADGMQMKSVIGAREFTSACGPRWSQPSISTLHRSPRFVCTMVAGSKHTRSCLPWRSSTELRSSSLLSQVHLLLISSPRLRLLISLTPLCHMHSK